MAYGTLYKFYDTLMTDFDYDGYVAFLAERLKGKRGLDLACGTGEITLRLARHGFEMTGGDNSVEMLNSAVDKAEKEKIKAKFILFDLTSPELPLGAYDFITVVCDGLNYVSDRHFVRAIKCIYGALDEGAQLVFDISTKAKLVNTLGNNLFFEDGDGLTYFWHNELSSDRVDMSLVFFEENPDGTYRRYDELQTQYIHSDEFVFDTLNDAGFKFEVFGGAFEPYKEGDDRMVILARK